MLDFARIKEIKLTDVIARYMIALRFKGEYAVCTCPLPTHKQGDTGKSFSINLAGNYFRCFSASCNEAAGCKGGDTINFVALMDGSSQLAAAKKLAGWFGIAEASKSASTEAKTPQRMAEGSKEKPKTQMQGSNQNGSIPSVEVKSGFLHETGLWLDDLLAKVIGDDVVRKSVKKAVMDRVRQSYLNGKSVRSV